MREKQLLSTARLEAEWIADDDLFTVLRRREFKLSDILRDALLNGGAVHRAVKNTREQNLTSPRDFNAHLDLTVEVSLHLKLTLIAVLICTGSALDDTSDDGLG